MRPLRIALRAAPALLAVLLLAEAVLGSSGATDYSFSSVSVDKPLYPYWKVGGEIPVYGQGFKKLSTYHIWLRKPSLKTSYLASFTTTSEGAIPSGVKIVLSRTDPPGTYFVGISTSENFEDVKTLCYFGVWGTNIEGSGRGEDVTIKGGGVAPNGYALIDIEVGSSSVSGYPQTVNTSYEGHFEHVWKIPGNASVGIYSIIVEGLGTFQNRDQVYSSSRSFIVAGATVDVAFLLEPTLYYRRLETATVQYEISYSNGSSVAAIKSTGEPIKVYRGEFKVGELPLFCLDAREGIWKAEWTIPCDAPVSSGYKFLIEANSLNDGYGSPGPSETLVSRSFEIKPTPLLVDVKTNRTTYMVGFDSIKIVASVRYSNGTDLKKGTVKAVIREQDVQIASLPMIFDLASECWMTKYQYQYPVFDHRQDLTIVVEADDEYGNAGKGSSKVSVSSQSLPPLYLLAFVGAAAASVFLLFMRKGRKPSKASEPVPTVPQRAIANAEARFKRLGELRKELETLKGRLEEANLKYGRGFTTMKTFKEEISEIEDKLQQVGRYVRELTV